MKKFLAEVDIIHVKIEEAKETLTEMNGLTRRVSGASEDKEAKDLRDSLEENRNQFIAIMEEINKSIKKTKTKVISKKQKKHEEHKKQQQIRSLVERTKKLIDEFSTVQSEFSKEERNRIKSQYIIAKPTATKEELEKVEYSESPKIPFLNQKSTSDEKKKSIKHIALGIQAVSGMTKDLNMLVHEKDRDVDKIEITTTKAEKKAKKADNDLEITEKYQRWARYGRLFFYSTIIIIVTILLLLVIGALATVIVINILNYISTDSSLNGNATDTSGNATGNATDTAGDGTGNTTGTEGSTPGLLQAGIDNLLQENFIIRKTNPDRH